MIQRRQKQRPEEQPQRATMADCLTGEPPADIDAEKALLGSVISNGDVIDEVALIVDNSDFFDQSHAALWGAMVAMHDRSKRIDLVTLVAELKREGLFDQVGGSAGLVRLSQATPTWQHATFYAQQVRKTSVKRKLLVAAAETVRDCVSDQLDPDECLERHESRVFCLGEREVGRESIDAKSLMRSAMESIDARRNRNSGDVVQTGFSELDEKLGGFRSGNLVIVAARPSVGKTSFALNLTENIAIANPGKVLFCSLEMSGDELSERLLSSSSGIPCHKMRNGTVTTEDTQKIVIAAAKIAKSPLHVIDDAGVSVRKIAAHARRMKRKGGLDILMIDYLQLIEAADRFAPREQQVSGMTRQLKVLARELKIPIICLAQLNRQSEAVGSNNRPKLSHLRESGAIEQDADVVLFVHREECFKTDDASLKGMAEIIVAKQRNGPTGTTKLIWKADVMRFENKADASKDAIQANAGGSDSVF